MLHILLILVWVYFLYKLLEFSVNVFIVVLIIWGFVYCYRWLASLVTGALSFIGLA